MPLGRRDFLRAIAAASGAIALEPVGANRRAQARLALPSPDASGIEHIVVVMMENRSFDHLLGWLPGADGRQAGLEYADRDGALHSTQALGADHTGCLHPDPDHSWEGGRAQYNDGTMDGFLRSGENDQFAIGYYGEPERPGLAALARQYTTCDRYFCSFLGPTFPNRLFLHAAQTDRIDNRIALTRARPIWDRLAAAGVSARYYFSNVPFVALWGTRYLPISRAYPQFLADAAAGTLPAVSFVDPRFTLGDDGTGNDDHPHADIGAGDAFIARTFEAVARAPSWPHTVFVVTYDEWGGFFDHVTPPRAAAANRADPDIRFGQTLLGFRVPTIVASPFTRGSPDHPRIDSRVFDHTSILKLIEWRWRLQPLTRRDGGWSVRNLVRTLDFEHPNADVPDLPDVTPPPPAPCAGPAPSRDALARRSSNDNAWRDLADSHLLDGWPSNPD